MISAVVVTNGKKIERLTNLLGKLKNLSDELVVIIDSSEYSLYIIIELYTNNIKFVPGKGFFEEYYEDILRNCTCEWILRIDDDEALDDSWSKEELEKLSMDTYATGYWFPRRWFINTKEYICTSPWHTDHQLRFFRNLPGIMMLPKNIHEALIVYGEVRRVDNLFIDHFCLLEDINNRKEKVEKYKLLNPYNNCEKFYLYENSTYDLTSKISNDSINYINECSIIQNQNDYCIKISTINLKKKMICGETYAGSIKITNYTRKTFLPESNLHNNYNNNIFISYHIYKDSDMNEIYSFDNRRFFLPSRLLPNESLEILISIEAPPIEGDFYIRFDIVEEQVTWFSQQNKADMYPLVKISMVELPALSPNVLHYHRWDFRYATAPELGSGVGSRGDAKSEEIQKLGADTAGEAWSVTPELQDLAAELDEWLRAGRRAKLWWRDDDVIADTPALRRLLGLAADFGTVVGLAVIPSEADSGLAAALRDAPCVVWQHGWLHKWTLDEDARQYSRGEFGEGRSLESMMHDAMEGQRAMDRLFGSHWERVFVPPFHALTMPFKSVVPSLGYRGLSSGLPYKPPLATVPEVSAEIDIIDWPKRCFCGPKVVVGLVVDQLRALRQGNVDEFRPVGILTHHRVMEEAAWDFTAELFAFLRHHPAAELIPADRVFDLLSSSLQKPPGSGEGPTRLSPGDVTVVITSCGRQDLLERTLDSFLQYNTHPIKEFILMEDGDGERNAALARKYSQHPMRWLCTGSRVGQIAAIDRAYDGVTTEYIFHCEDDWEFYAAGFIEKSKVILENNPSILQVWLRGLADTNRHPLIDFGLSITGVDYQLLRHHYDAGESGVWHGLSWNPGLRRTRDYQLLGSFGSLDPDTKKETWRVECEAGAFYQQLGFYAAVLADNGGEGYVRHIGANRQVPRDYLSAGSNATSSRDSERIVENLIFDVGAHHGEDTAYYLRRGFCVVAVECAPAQIAVMRSRFESELRDGRLTLVERAIAPRSGPVTFYQNNTKTVWGTAEKTWAERNIALGTEVVEITVNGIQPEELFNEYGIPYYLKVDLEGCDGLMLRALEGFSVRPPYLSLEAEERSMQALREEFAVLRRLGYDHFKLSPQHHVGKQQGPGGSLQGRPVIWNFEGGSSGPFGEDLAGPWLDEENALKAYEPIMLIYDLDRAIKRGVLTGSLNQFLSEFGYELGWYDTHARHGSWSGRPPRASFAVRSDATSTDDSQEPAEANEHTVTRNEQARRLMGVLAPLVPFSFVAQACERRVPGIDEVPEWQLWVDRETTSDQRWIEEQLETRISPSARLLHIGAGNSSLGSRFARRVEVVLGTTIHDEERLLAESLGLANYSVVVANKYSSDMDRVTGSYDFIIDNNPASFACCLFHFARMLVTYVDLLNAGGLLLTADPGMRWVVTNNDPNWALSLEEWRRVGEIVGMPLEDLGGHVYALRRSAEAGSAWRGL